MEENLGVQTQESRTPGESESVPATSERKIKAQDDSRSPIREENGLSESISPAKTIRVYRGPKKTVLRDSRSASIQP